MSAILLGGGLLLLQVGTAEGEQVSLAPVAMGLGMMLSFADIGVVLGALGPALGINADTIRVAGAAVLIAFALVMVVPALGERFSRWMLPIASAANAASTRPDGGSLFSAAALGAVLGLAWSRCSGPLLGSALTLVASEGGALRDGVVLALFGLGAAISLVAVATPRAAGSCAPATGLSASSASGAGLPCCSAAWASPSSPAPTSGSRRVSWPGCRMPG